MKNKSSNTSIGYLQKISNAMRAKMQLDLARKMKANPEFKKKVMEILEEKSPNQLSDYLQSIQEKNQQAIMNAQRMTATPMTEEELNQQIAESFKTHGQKNKD